MSKLAKIKDFVQKTAEVISAVVEVEILIIDTELEVIAGTGAASSEVGKVYQGSLTKQVLDSGNYIMVDEPRFNSLCKDCYKGQSNCLHTAVLVYGIQIEGEVLGSISLCAVGTEQRKLLLASEDRLVEFIARIGDLIASTIKSQEVQKENLLLANQFEAVVNAVHEGILAIDHEGMILHSNQSARDALNMEFNGVHINKVFPGLFLEELNVDAPTVENLFSGTTKKQQFMGMVSPIRTKDKVAGFVFSFRPIKEVHRIAGQLTDNRITYTFDNIIGKEPVFLRALQQMKKVARTDSTVLIRGESGTGKEICARAIHAESSRHLEPFIAINCAAIPESLLESELFGYADGAFTGAVKGGKPGKFELASGGTIFLDEIGDMPLHLQVKLLRVLENKFIERVGGGTELISVNVRIIAATHRNLEKMMHENEFREDLYYRLNVIPVHLPALRERSLDIVEFIGFFIKKYNHHLDKNITGITIEAKKLLLNYSWPGNVRELENTLEYAVNMETSRYITLESLPARILNAQRPVPETAVKTPQRIRQIEARAITEALDLYGWNSVGKEKAAQELGISLSTLYRRIKGLHLSERRK